MIVCPNCNHSNPEGATQCEACYTPLPSLAQCPSCGASIQTNATFCGQCGFALSTTNEEEEPSPTLISSSSAPETSPTPPTPPTSPNPIPSVAPGVGMATQLQVQLARLFHIQTQGQIELPCHLSVIHIGKPNDLVPPDIDVSGFPDSDVVSRMHADIRVEGDSFYIEDIGSSNGTYINHTPLLPGNRHRLRNGDRISLGKGDKVSFLFQLIDQ